MNIVYFERLTLVDYPGKLAVTVFTVGCPFRCPYCHSPELVDPNHPDFAASAPNQEEQFFDFLQQRIGKLDGVCITGGEPMLHKDLEGFIRRVKTMGFAVKLDTNGSFPDRVATLLQTGLVDYWAMDIKHTREKYAQACGRNINVSKIARSIELIMSEAKDYEFRTTAVPGIHIPEDFAQIGQWIAGARAYRIQPFRTVKVLDRQQLTASNDISLDYDKCANYAREHIPDVVVR